MHLTKEAGSSKKNQKYLLQLDVRPAASLSAAGPRHGDNGLYITGESIMLVRAQDACGDWDAALQEAEVAVPAAEAKYTAVKDYADRVRDAVQSAAIPGSTAWPTLEAVRGNATARAEEYANNPLLYHYASIVARDATHPTNTGLAGQNARHSADRITPNVEISLKGFNFAFEALLSDGTTTLRRVSKPAPEDYPDDGFSFYYAEKAHSIGGNGGLEALQTALAKANSITSGVEEATVAVADAARTESTRRYDAELVKEAAREAAEDSKGTRREAAAMFVFGKATGDTPEEIFNSINAAAEQFKDSLGKVLTRGCVFDSVLREGFNKLNQLAEESDNPLEEFRAYVRRNPERNLYVGLSSFCLGDSRYVPSDYRGSIETYVNMVKNADIPGDDVSTLNYNFQSLVRMVNSDGSNGAHKVAGAAKQAYEKGNPTASSVARKAKGAVPKDEPAANVVAKAAEAAAQEAGATPASVAAAAAAKKQFVDAPGS